MKMVKIHALGCAIQDGCVVGLSQGNWSSVGLVHKAVPKP